MAWNAEDLAKFMDGTRYAYWSESLATLFVWHGGPTVNLVRVSGGEAENDDCFTLYRREGYPTLEEVHDAVTEHERETLRSDETAAAKGLSGAGSPDVRGP